MSPIAVIGSSKFLVFEELETYSCRCICTVIDKGLAHEVLFSSSQRLSKPALRSTLSTAANVNKENKKTENVIAFIEIY